MLFGIFALIVVGGSWTLTGAIMGDAPKKKIEPALVTQGGALVAVIAGLIIHFLSGTACAQNIPDKILWLTCLAFFCSGLLNGTMLLIMAKAMQHGPNGVIWTIIQSAMIFPFLLGIFFFNVEPKLVRIAGLLLILAGLILSGYAKDNSSSDGGKWRAITFLAFLLTGVSQSLSNIPSYFESARNVSPVIRSVCLAGGVFFTATVCMLAKFNKSKNPGSQFRSKWLWIYIGSQQFFSLIFAYLLLYPGMDAMAKHGIGSAAYPLMVASSLISFFFYSRFLIKEKNSLLQYGVLTGCLLGIILICC